MQKKNYKKNTAAQIKTQNKFLKKRQGNLLSGAADLLS